jgi:glycosyltransferase involved in cell wall biosynthesis
LREYRAQTMAILSTTLCYPNPTMPGLGIFVQRRLAEVHKRIRVNVVAPIPICPPIRRRAAIPDRNEAASPPVAWPSMFYVPGILKKLDAYFYARALDVAIGANPLLSDSELIDAHFVWPDGVGASRVARQRGLPFVCTIRGKLVSQSKFPARRRMIAEMLRDADRLIAVSQSLADLACDVAEQSLDIAMIPNGVDTEIFRQRSTAHEAVAFNAAEPDGVGPANDPSSQQTMADKKQAEPLVISVGHFQRLKGFHRLIEAWPDVLRQHKQARLILVGGPAGEPAYERHLQTLATKLNNASPQGTAPPITFAGRKSPNEIANLLNAADCFALASDSEGWCNAIAEALACGCPVVATDVGGNREQLGSDESFGRLIPLDDPNALASAIVHTIENPPDRAAIARHGSRRSWQQVAAECVDVYQSLLS